MTNASLHRCERIAVGRDTVSSIPSAATLIRFVLALFVVCGLAALPKPSAAAEIRPTEHDTGYEIIPLITTPSVYWLDNRRLLFSGMRAGHGPRKDVRKVYVWNADTNSFQIYADVSAVCFSDGFISYRVHVDKAARTETVREGPFGSEIEIVRPLPPLGAIRSNLTCRTHKRTDLVPPQSLRRLIVVLRAGDGYLDLGPSDISEKRTPVRNIVLHGDGQQPLQLPMTWDEDFSTSGVVYSAYRNAYILRPRAPRGALDIGGHWPKAQPLTVYLMWANGRTETILIPYLPAEFLSNPRPTRGGWIFGGGNIYKSSGLYVFSDEAVSKIDVGLVKEIAVTPDGCRAAVAIQNDHLHAGTPTRLKVFDFCSSS
jgi:hypothetical protein